MKIFKKTIAVLACIIIISAIVSGYDNKKVNAQGMQLRQRPIAIDVLLYNFEDKYISLVRQSLEDIQKQNPGKVEFKFYDSKGNQSIQNEILDNILRTERIDILLVNLVDPKATGDVIQRVKGKDLPLIFFNREPVATEVIKSYPKSYYVGTNASEAGALQGKILINLWNNDRSFIDKNNNGILQYIMLQGERGSIEAQERTESVISTIQKAGIKTEQLALIVCDWRRDFAKDAISKLFLQYDTRIEAIIANNDEMAIGAIEALQGYGYNKGDKAKTIAVVGVDATPEARELIRKGEMAGSVFQDPSEMAKAIYLIGMNVYLGKDPLAGTPYKFDATGVSVRLPYKEYTNKGGNV
ncbi:galactose ABC transporter substrate-binding protein [Clostridium sp.]|uniref:galactose ABC transporter substrate-binding protein n=1 Tax=Clostridium sp. TaxID=1506 RepID=UPI00261D1EF8|nr:galactose ABC transporter substrate-binding protein [Clostridium sp.]